MCSIGDQENEDIHRIRGELGLKTCTEQEIMGLKTCTEQIRRMKHKLGGDCVIEDKSKIRDQGIADMHRIGKNRLHNSTKQDVMGINTCREDIGGLKTCTQQEEIIGLKTCTEQEVLGLEMSTEQEIRRLRTGKGDYEIEDIHIMD